MSETLTPAQRRTLPARQALEAKFASTAEKSEYFRGLARRSHGRRLVLSGDEAAGLLAAYALLRSIAERVQFPTDSPNDQQASATGGTRRRRTS